MIAHKEAGIPFAEGLDTVLDLPYTIAFAISYRARINSFNELPKDKKPPRNLWDKPQQLSDYLDTVWDTKNTSDKGKNYIDIDLEEVE